MSGPFRTRHYDKSGGALAPPDSGSSRWPLALALAAIGGSLTAAGVLGIFALWGLVPLLVGAILFAMSLGLLSGLQRLWLTLAAALAAACAVSFLLFGSEYLWGSPSCSAHPNQVSGQITYWSGATVSWTCVNGQPVITHDSRLPPIRPRAT